MNKRTFGSTRVEVPIIGQGTWDFRDKEGAARALRLGLDLGMNHIDTAELYRGSEEVVADAIQGRRGDVFLVSKVLPSHASYAGTKQACEQSLDRLRTDHVDVFLLHWWSHQYPIEDTMRAMGELVDEGKTRFVGVSNLGVEQLEQAQAALGKRRIVCNQVYYDLRHRHLERDLLPHCQRNDVALVGYSPFGSGDGTKLPKAEALRSVAQRHHVTIHQVVLNFLARRRGVFLIPKAEREDHVRQNSAALDFELSPTDVEELEDAYPVPERVEELPTI